MSGSWVKPRLPESPTTKRACERRYGFAGSIGRTPGASKFSWSFGGDVPNVTRLERVTVAFNSGGGIRNGDVTSGQGRYRQRAEDNCAVLGGSGSRHGFPPGSLQCVSNYRKSASGRLRRDFVARVLCFK